MTILNNVAASSIQAVNDVQTASSGFASMTKAYSRPPLHDALIVAVVTKPFHFEGRRRMQQADKEA